MSDVYYKIQLSKENQYRVVCLQDFDETDYHSDDYLKDQDGNPYVFWETEDGERKARSFLNKVIKPEFIHPDDLIANNEHMYKIPMEDWEA
ncbi:hypothetical protein IMZ31_21930 (plasmid) [Pontibacillus sp. ALD_SL1]|uniref:hypothetical protein n=1 Tax=Pontibacillus sp. ALD_SL1 TaxID=2777185 RepID=UPI001A974412|nr:hypothetical protein [Pontibacillus sp. ALD_SL1]QST02113.1 hypothetical protein IMZ31_21930 [Pontibacillus sp. ALD_SL1]